jgi:hypothetical protein
MDHESVEEVKRHFNVVAESLRGEIRILADALGANTDRLDGLEQAHGGLTGRLDRFEAYVAAEFVETRAMIRLSYGELERRIQTLENRA